MKKKNIYSKGFTLLELLLVTSLTVFTGMAVYSAFSRGLAVYEWLERGRPGSEVSFLFERIAEDLRNLCPFPEKGFSGTAKSMIFHVNRPENIIFDDDRMAGAAAGSPEKVRYVYYEQPGIIRRYVFEYGASEPFYAVTVMEKIEGMKFSYLEFTGRESAALRTIDGTEEIPDAVKIEFSGLLSRGGGFTRIIEIPIKGR